VTTNCFCRRKQNLPVKRRIAFRWGRQSTIWNRKKNSLVILRIEIILRFGLLNQRADCKKQTFTNVCILFYISLIYFFIKHIVYASLAHTYLANVIRSPSTWITANESIHIWYTCQTYRESVRIYSLVMYNATENIFFSSTLW